VSALDRVVAALEVRDCRPRGSDARGYSALCPAHEDRTPSLVVYYEGDKVLVHCHAGCAGAEVVRALGLEWRDLFDSDLRRSGRERHVLVPLARPSELAATHDLFDEW
jgi:DNA primase